MGIPDISAAVLAQQSHLRLPSRPEWSEAAATYLKNIAVLCGACHEARAGKLMVALHEALSNSIIHGNLEVSSDLREQGDGTFAEALAVRMSDPALASRRIDVLFDYDGERCRWIITDQGRGFNVEKVLARVDGGDQEVLLASGRGILIMRTFLDDVSYELNGRRVILTMLRLSGAEKRRHDRRPMHHPLRIVPVRDDGSPDWDAAYDAVSRNISEHGLNVLQEQLTAATRIVIGLPRADNGRISPPRSAIAGRWPAMWSSWAAVFRRWKSRLGPGQPWRRRSRMPKPSTRPWARSWKSTSSSHFPATNGARTRGWRITSASRCAARGKHR